MKPSTEPRPEHFPTTSWRERAHLAFAQTRPAFLAVTASAWLIGTASAYACGIRIDGALAFLSLMLALCAHAAGNVLNDGCDALNGADAHNENRLYPFTGGSRFIQNGVTDIPSTFRLAAMLGGGVIAAGIPLAWTVGHGLFPIGAAGLMMAWAYSAPPMQLNHRGLGEPIIAITWALVTLGADFVQRGFYSPLALAVGVGHALLVANVLFINGFPDASSDQRAHKRTWAVRVGLRAGPSLYLTIVLAAHAWIGIAVMQDLLPMTALLAGLGLIPGLAAHWRFSRWVRKALKTGISEFEGLRPAIALTIASPLLHAIGLAVGLWLVGQARSL